MTRKLTVTAAAWLFLCATAGVAQETPKDTPSGPNWHNLLKQDGITENGFAAQLAIRAETRPDGARVVVVKNSGRSSLFYEGYGPDNPRLFNDEFKAGAWVPGGWNWCGTGLGHHEIKPGESRAFSLRKPSANQRLRHWTIFTDTATRKAIRAASDPPAPVKRGKESMMLLGESG